MAGLYDRCLFKQTMQDCRLLQCHCVLNGGRSFSRYLQAGPASPPVSGGCSLSGWALSSPSCQKQPWISLLPSDLSAGYDVLKSFCLLKGKCSLSIFPPRCVEQFPFAPPYPSLPFSAVLCTSGRLLYVPVASGFQLGSANDFS